MAAAFFVGIPRKMHTLPGWKLASARASCATASSPLASRTSTCTQSPRNTEPVTVAGAAIGRPSFHPYRFRSDADPLDPVHRPKEARDEAGLRPQVHVFGRPHLFHSAPRPSPPDGPTSERLLLIVRDQQERDPDSPLHRFSSIRICLRSFGSSAASGSSSNRTSGCSTQRARQRHTLPFAPGKLRWPPRFLA